MNPSVRKAINILSYVLNVLFIVLFIIGLCNLKKPSQEETIQSIKDSVLSKEKAELPLKVQEFERVYAITINDIVLTNNVEPYDGYLSTTWDVDEKQNLTIQQWVANGHKDKYIRKQKEVLVELSGIRTTSNGGSLWQADWVSAYISAAYND